MVNLVRRRGHLFVGLSIYILTVNSVCFPLSENAMLPPIWPAQRLAQDFYVDRKCAQSKQWAKVTVLVQIHIVQNRYRTMYILG